MTHVRPQFERITAAEIRVGDIIAKTQNGPLMEVLVMGPPGSTARYIQTKGAGRIRPNYATKFWRLLEQDQLDGMEAY